MAQAVGGAPSKAEIERFERAFTMCQLGDPQVFIELMLKIETDGSDGMTRLVPMLFSNEPNQQFYHKRLFDRATWEGLHPGQTFMPWVVDALTLKDRKARWTSYWTAILFAKMVCIPGTHVLCITDSEDTFLPVNKFLNGYFTNMPQWARPVLKAAR